MLDPLTLIYNRRYFLDRFDSEFKFAIRHKKDLAVIFFDIDHFKNLNDNYGHSTGDEALRIIADKVSEIIRAEDLFARWGGEEFVLL